MKCRRVSSMYAVSVNQAGQDYLSRIWTIVVKCFPKDSESSTKEDSYSIKILMKLNFSKLVSSLGFDFHYLAEDALEAGLQRVHFLYVRITVSSSDPKVKES